MVRSKWFLQGNHTLEARVLRVMTALEIWIYENDQPLARHSIVRLADVARGLATGVDLLAAALENATADVQQGRFDPAGARQPLRHRVAS